jgi:hypothetical protein
MRRIEAARVKHMSNAKWRKFFAVMHSLSKPLGDVGIKFVNDKRLFVGSVPGPTFEHEDHVGECGGISYARFTHIEYIQVPHKYERELEGPRYPATEFTNDVKTLIERLDEAGNFPIEAYDGGIRILGYEWDSRDTAN